MRIFLICVISLLLSANTFAKDKEIIKRYQLDNWERDIGYSGITQVGKTLYISGIACDGENMQIAVKKCYQTITGILSKFNVGSDHIVKENIYTLNIDELIKTIPDRKTFFKGEKYPAATWVQVSRLYNPAHLLEIELIVELD